MRRLSKTVVAIAIVGAAMTAAYLEIKSIGTEDAGRSASWGAVYWRARLFFDKAIGKVPELHWRELWEMARARGGFGLELFAVHGSRPLALENPYISAEDLKIGQGIFHKHCGLCHGATGAGNSGPPLDRAGFKHGDSNWQIYKVLRDGVPETAMRPTDLSFVERWQVIGYLKKELQLRNKNQTLETHEANIAKVTSQQIENYESSPGDWLTYSGSLTGWRYSPLAEITPANVSTLRMRWMRQLRSDDEKYESTPLVVGDFMFLTVPPATVVSLNAKTGAVVWKYVRTLPDSLPLCCGRVNRGLAILGDTLFFASLDGYLVAINAKNGKVIWQTQVAKSTDGYSMTGAPLAVKDSVIVGVAGGEFGIRGMLAAFDAATGQRRWKFDTIPGPGEFGHETWKSEAWKNGGGSTWITGAYDPSLNLVYWGVANPSPPYSGDRRPGDNLFTNSVVALNADSGKLVWHFQFSPHDEHDWDSAQTPILANILINGVSRKVICWANRNGFYYVLDRSTGEFLSGVPFVEQNWAEGLTAAGRPIPTTKANEVTRPSIEGGLNWQPSAFDPTRGLIFVPAVEGAAVFTKSDVSKLAPERGGMFVGSGATGPESLIFFVRALEAATGVRKWEYQTPKTGVLDHGGLLATAGGVVFGLAGGVFFALESATGQELWRVDLGGLTVAAPISFTLGGRQVIAVLAGQTLIVFGL